MASRYRPVRAGENDSAEAIKTYLQAIVGPENYRAELIDAFVAQGREALAFLESEGAVKYSLRPLSPDYYPDEAGAVDVGRALEVIEFDGRALVLALLTYVRRHRECCCSVE